MSFTGFLITIEYDDFESAAIDCSEIENKIKYVKDSLSEVFPDVKNFFDINALPAKVISFCELR